MILSVNLLGVYATVSDIDEDGVPDINDKCSGSTGIVDSYGCDCNQKEDPDCSKNVPSNLVNIICCPNCYEDGSKAGCPKEQKVPFAKAPSTPSDSDEQCIYYFDGKNPTSVLKDTNSGKAFHPSDFFSTKEDITAAGLYKSTYFFVDTSGNYFYRNKKDFTPDSSGPSIDNKKNIESAFSFSDPKNIVRIVHSEEDGMVYGEGIEGLPMAVEEIFSNNKKFSGNLPEEIDAMTFYNGIFLFSDNSRVIYHNGIDWNEIDMGDYPNLFPFDSIDAMFEYESEEGKSLLVMFADCGKIDEDCENLTDVKVKSSKPSKFFEGTIFELYLDSSCLSISDVKTMITLGGVKIEPMKLESGASGVSNIPWAYSWDSTGHPEGDYLVEVMVEDKNGDITKLENTIKFSIIPRKCVKIFPESQESEGWENAKDKIDVVFIGDKFTDLNDFKEQVKMHAGLKLGSDNSEDGILNVEPFSSNIEKFNIYLVDKLSDLDCTDILVNGAGVCDSTKVNNLAAHCPYDFINVLSRREGRSNADFLGTSRTYIGNDDGTFGITRVSVHEFGHSFGTLLDEYIETNTGQGLWAYFKSKNCYSEPPIADIDCGFATCFSGDGCLAGCDSPDEDCGIISITDGICTKNFEDSDCKSFCDPSSQDYICIFYGGCKDLDCKKGKFGEDGICMLNLLGIDDPDCLDLCGEDSVCIESGCYPEDPDCIVTTCNAGDRCMIGCSPIDTDCYSGTCSKGDGCGGGLCNPPDPDCYPATCLSGDGCLINCLNVDQDCILECDADKPSCTEITCDSGDGCAIGCMGEDVDCGAGVSCNSGDGCKAGCFQSLSKEDCISNSQWSDLNGDGCGDEGVIDCNPGDYNFFGNDNLEVSCHEGCWYTEINYFRSSFNTIMRSLGYNPYGFGPVNERLICKNIGGETGSAGGICKNYDLSKV